MRSEDWPSGRISIQIARNDGLVGFLPVAGVVVMEDMSRGKSNNPQANNEAAHGEDPFADGTVVRG